MGQKREVITSEVGIISRHNIHSKSATLKDWPRGCTISSKLCPVKWGSGHVGTTNQLAGVEFESPQPPPWGEKGEPLLGVPSPSDPSRARRARIRKLLMVMKLDLSSSPPRVASRLLFSFCFIFPSPLHSHLILGILCFLSLRL